MCLLLRPIVIIEDWYQQCQKKEKCFYAMTNSSLFKRRELNILVAIYAQIEWSTKWGERGKPIRKMSREHLEADILQCIEIHQSLWECLKKSLSQSGRAARCENIFLERLQPLFDHPAESIDEDRAMIVKVYIVSLYIWGEPFSTFTKKHSEP